MAKRYICTTADADAEVDTGRNTYIASNLKMWMYMEIYRFKVNQHICIYICIHI